MCSNLHPPLYLLSALKSIKFRNGRQKLGSSARCVVFVFLLHTQSIFNDSDLPCRTAVPPSTVSGLLFCILSRLISSTTKKNTAHTKKASCYAFLPLPPASFCSRPQQKTIAYTMYKLLMLRTTKNRGGDENYRSDSYYVITPPGIRSAFVGTSTPLQAKGRKRGRRTSF